MKTKIFYTLPLLGALAAFAILPVNAMVAAFAVTAAGILVILLSDYPSGAKALPQVRTVPFNASARSMRELLEAA